MTKQQQKRIEGLTKKFDGLHRKAATTQGEAMLVWVELQQAIQGVTGLDVGKTNGVASRPPAPVAAAT